MVGCFCYMVKAVVSNNFYPHRGCVHALAFLFFFFFPRDFWVFFQEFSVFVILVKRIKICRYLTGTNALYLSSVILFTPCFVAYYLAGMSG